MNLSKHFIGVIEFFLSDGRHPNGASRVRQHAMAVNSEPGG